MAAGSTGTRRRTAKPGSLVSGGCLILARLVRDRSERTRATSAQIVAARQRQRYYMRARTRACTLAILIAGGGNTAIFVTAAGEHTIPAANTGYASNADQTRSNVAVIYQELAK